MFDLDSLRSAPSSLRRGLVGAALVTLAAVVAPTALASGSGGGAPASADDGRVLVLGFDGADWRTTESMMDSGGRSQK